MTNPVRENDRELVARCRAGDAAAERALYDAHVERVYRLAYRMAGDPDVAADITQETFIRAFDRLDQYRGDSSLSTWLHAVGVSVALNTMRKVKRFPARNLPLEAAADHATDDRRLAPDLRDKLHAAIDALSEKLKPVLLMYVEGYTHEEIAGALSIPIGTSKARLFDARAKLRTALAVFVEDYIA